MLWLRRHYLISSLLPFTLITGKCHPDATYHLARLIAQDHVYPRRNLQARRWRGTQGGKLRLGEAVDGHQFHG